MQGNPCWIRVAQSLYLSSSYPYSCAQKFDIASRSVKLMKISWRRIGTFSLVYVFVQKNNNCTFCLHCPVFKVRFTRSMRYYIREADSRRRKSLPSTVSPSTQPLFCVLLSYTDTKWGASDRARRDGGSERESAGDVFWVRVATDLYSQRRLPGTVAKGSFFTSLVSLLYPKTHFGLVMEETFKNCKSYCH